MSDLWYPEVPPEEAPIEQLDCSKLPIHSVIKNIDSVSPEEFTMSRREGFGGSDSGVLLGVNPYKTLSELIREKASREISQEELDLKNNVAIMKGNDLEPLIIDKASKILGLEVFKPTDTYEFNEFPYLRMNFDGVSKTAEGAYFPVEIKVVTKRGERHYNPVNAMFIERVGMNMHNIVTSFEGSNNSVQTKAAMVGIPPYYFTQVQQEIMALNAEFGYLAALEESSWRVCVYYIPKDIHTQNAIKINGFNAWEKVEALRKTNGYYNETTT